MEQVQCSVTLISGRSHFQPAMLWRQAHTSQLTPVFSMFITLLCPLVWAKKRGLFMGEAGQFFEPEALFGLRMEIFNRERSCFF